MQRLRTLAAATLALVGAFTVATAAFVACVSLVHADQVAGAAPSDGEIKDRLVGSLNAQLQYAAVLIERLRAEVQASEARAKWAVGKLWKLPDEAKPGEQAPTK